MFTVGPENWTTAFSRLQKKKKSGEQKMSKRIYLIIVIISFLINLFFLVFLLKDFLTKKNSNDTKYALKKIFSNETFELIVEDEKSAAEDFSILARNNEGKESVICIIANQKKINLSWDSIENRKSIRSFAWEEQFEASKNHKYYYKLTRDNVQYFAYSPDLIWTYKMYYDSGKTHVSCFYKGQWERVKKFDINTLTFHLESGIELHWDCEKKDWEKEDF